MFSQLNASQSSAIRCIDIPCLVLAGAGSGKTRVITYKIAHLISHCQYPANRIAAVTFTNKAAKEMKQRVFKLLDKKLTKGLQISTFHTLGLNILKRSLQQLGLKPGFSIYDGADSLGLIRELMRKTFSDPKNLAEQAQRQISRWKNAFILPVQAQQQANGDPRLTAAAMVYEQYVHHLRTYNAVDFDDLLMLPVLLLRQHDEIRQYWQEKIRYLLVDEYQDTNTTQYELVKLIVGDSRRLTVVGDDDQSIYSWRGAQPENLALLNNDFPDLNIVKLEQNYRSSGRILNVANALIKNNSHIFEKHLWSELGYGDPVRVITCNNEDNEAEQIIAEINHHIFTHRNQYSDYAILYRGNHQSRLFERYLREHNMPYYLSGSMSFFSCSEIKDLLAYLRMVSNPDDDNAFIRIVNTPRRGIGPSTLETLNSFANQDHSGKHSLFSACHDSTLSTSLSTRAYNNLKHFAEWILDINHIAETESPVAAFNRIIQDTRFEQWLMDTSKDEQAAMRRIENMNELLNWIKRLHSKEPEATLHDLVTKLTLIDTLENDDDNEKGNRIHLMTLHAAKGLEFPHVFMVGMEENILPHRASIEEETIEEERRIAYVGITRAQKTLTLSYAQQRKQYGEIVDCTPSRFIDELPQTDLHWVGKDNNQNEAQIKQQGQNHLANLKALLSES